MWSVKKASWDPTKLRCGIPNKTPHFRAIIMGPQACLFSTPLPGRCKYCCVTHKGCMYCCNTPTAHQSRSCRAIKGAYHAMLPGACSPLPAPARVLWHRSTPIEVVSRGHRLPKPYGGRVTTLPGCRADPLSIPAAVWPASHDSSSSNYSSKGGSANKGGAHKESLSRHGLWFKLTRVYLQVRFGRGGRGAGGRGGGRRGPLRHALQTRQTQTEDMCLSVWGMRSTESILGSPYYSTLFPR